jgi:hypothetical protein
VKFRNVNPKRIQAGQIWEAWYGDSVYPYHALWKVICESKKSFWEDNILVVDLGRNQAFGARCDNDIFNQKSYRLKFLGHNSEEFDKKYNEIQNKIANF